MRRPEDELSLIECERISDRGYIYIDINEYPVDSRCSKFHYLFIISPRDFPLIAINRRPQLAAVMAWRP